MAYILDSNTMITAKNLYYAYDLVPSFWRVLLDEFRKGTVKIIDAVESEIMQGNDELSEWVSRNICGESDESGELYSLPAQNSQAIVQCYRTIASNIVLNQQFQETSKQRFLSGADPWLIAAAKTNGHVVVTFEEMPPANTTKVKIPAICWQMGVTCENLYEMMRKLNVRI